MHDSCAPESNAGLPVQCTVCSNHLENWLTSYNLQPGSARLPLRAAKVSRVLPKPQLFFENAGLRHLVHRFG